MASVLKCIKMNSFVLKLMRVMSMLSPLASKSCGGSHISFGQLVSHQTVDQSQLLLSQSTNHKMVS